MKIIFAGWTRTLSDSQILNDLGIVDRLLSYYELKDQTDEDLASFVESGNWPIRKKPIKQNFDDKRYLAMRRLGLAQRLNLPEPSTSNEEYLDDSIPF